MRMMKHDRMNGCENPSSGTRAVSERHRPGDALFFETHDRTARPLVLPRLVSLFRGPLLFERSPNLLATTSLGISAIVGVALLLSTTAGGNRMDFWATFRLFLMPFCVSGVFRPWSKAAASCLVFSPSKIENGIAAAFCVAFCAFVLLVSKWAGAPRVAAGDSASRFY